MTSNVGSQSIREFANQETGGESMGQMVEDMMKGDIASTAKRLAELQQQVNDALRATFRPEFLNRIDDVVAFNALTIDGHRAHRGPAAATTCATAWPTAASRST